MLWKHIALAFVTVRRVTPRRLAVKALRHTSTGDNRAIRDGAIDSSTLAEIWSDCVGLGSKQTETENACPESRGANWYCRGQGQGLRQ